MHILTPTQTHTHKHKHKHSHKHAHTHPHSRTQVPHDLTRSAHADVVKVVKCQVDGIAVDISANALGGLCTLCLLEKVSVRVYMYIHTCDVAHMCANTLSGLSLPEKMSVGVYMYTRTSNSLVRECSRRAVYCVSLQKNVFLVCMCSCVRLDSCVLKCSMRACLLENVSIRVCVCTCI